MLQIIMKSQHLIASLHMRDTQTERRVQTIYDIYDNLMSISIFYFNGVVLWVSPALFLANVV